MNVLFMITIILSIIKVGIINFLNNRGLLGIPGSKRVMTLKAGVAVEYDVTGEL